MESFDAPSLARAQFAFTISFHIVFPAFSIGLASYLAVLNALWLATGRKVYFSLFQYWKKIFAIAFGMGVVSGLVMSYQFGTWSLFSRLRNKLYEDRWLHRAALVMGPAGFAAVLAGWITTEVGRQPYTVYGLLTTAQSASSIAAPAVGGASSLAFIVVLLTGVSLVVGYALLGATWLIWKTDGSRSKRRSAMPAAPASRPSC